LLKVKSELALKDSKDSFEELAALINQALEDSSPDDRLRPL
jgi:hypothetical protein